MWQSIAPWLLRELLFFVDEDDVYRLWVFAEEYELDRLSAYLTIESDVAPLSKAHAKYLAMGYACWTAVHRLAGRPTSPRLSKRSIAYISDELERLVRPLRRHCDREIAMLTIAEPRSVPACVLYFAAKEGNLESLIWLHHVAQYDPPETVRVAARHGHDHVICWLLENTHTAHWLDPDQTIQAVFQYHDDPALGVVAWRVSYRGEPPHLSAFSNKWGFADTDLFGGSDDCLIDLAAKSGDLDGIQRLVANECFETAYSRRAIEHAASFGYLSILEWFYSYDRDLFDTSNVLFFAATNGQLEVAKWLAAHKRHGSDMHLTFDGVVRNGHLSVLRWLVETYPRETALYLDQSLLALACRQDHLPIVAWFMDEQRYKPARYHLQHAATGGQMEVFQWLLARLDPSVLDPSLLGAAAEGGNLAFVQWLVEQCGIWSPTAITSATKNTTPGIADYLYSTTVKRGDPLPDLRTVHRSPWIRDGAFEMFTWLLTHGLTSDILVKRGVDRIHDFERTLARRNDQLGWTDCIVRHEYWPRTHATMAQLRSLLRLIVDVYDPHFLRTITWLPAWAVEHGSIATLERLDQIRHTRILSAVTFRRLLRTSKDADKAQWFLLKAPERFSTRVVQWAVQYDQRCFLQWLLDTFLPTIVGSDSDLRFRCVQTAMWSARKHNRHEVLQLIPSK